MKYIEGLTALIDNKEIDLLLPKTLTKKKHASTATIEDLQILKQILETLKKRP